MANVRGVHLLCWALMVGLALAADQQQQQQQQTQAPACKPTGENAHEQLINLSKLIDPSGRLAKMVADFHPPTHDHNHNSSESKILNTLADPMKRSAESERQTRDAQVANSTSVSTSETPSSTEPPVASSTQSPVQVTSSAPSSTTVASTTTSTAPPTTQATPVTVAPPTSAPPALAKTEASNVTVNVFLQLVPDAKTEELINNPDSAVASTSAQPEPSSSQPTTSVPLAAAAAATASSTQAPPSSSTQEPASSSTTPASTSAGPSSSTPAPTSPAPPSSVSPTLTLTRRRRSPPVAAEASPPTQPPTSAPPASSAQPLSTTTANVGQVSNEAPTSTSSPPASASSTSTTTLATTTTTTASTTTATPTTTSTAAPVSSSQQPVQRASSSSTAATVEISAKDLPLERKLAELPATIEIIVSSVAATPTVVPSSTLSPTTSTTSAKPAATSSQPASSSATGGIQAGTQGEELKEIQTLSLLHPTLPAQGKQTNLNSGEDEQPPVGLEQLARVFQVPEVKTSPLVADKLGTELQKSGNVAPLEPSSSAAIDNLNVIYDNDTTIVELHQSKQQPNEDPQLTPSITGKQRIMTNTKIADFVISDRAEEQERENFATCLLESQSRRQQIGRLNFWQPVNNGGILHLNVHVRYRRDLSGLSWHALNKRESFRTPIEQPPANGLLAEAKPNLRHQIWLVESCARAEDGLKRRLVSEVRPTGDANGEFVDVDAELVVAKFNLTGPNELANKHLTFNLPNGKPISCCKVAITDSPQQAGEFENLPAVSVVQPIRESLLPSKSKLADKDIGDSRLPNNFNVGL